MHLIDRLLTNQIIACIDASESSFSNGENCSSLSCSDEKLYKKLLTRFFLFNGPLDPKGCIENCQEISVVIQI
jgi:hypothetical protein